MDKRSKTSADNGKKGGRPLATSTIIAQKTKEYIAIEVEKKMKPIVSKAIEQAEEGDKSARDFLFDRFMGKPVQATELTGKDGKDLIPTDELRAKANEAVVRYLNNGRD